MLVKILFELSKIKTESYHCLAQKIGVKEPLLKQLLNDLSWMGYIYLLDCETRYCKGCFMGKTCSSNNNLLNSMMTSWRLTEKGRAKLTKKKSQFY